ncbi:hypothetical protein C7419_1012817 [Cupriavidus plantarum]|uniref:Uncharacterized protein n=1 Tax=Cupriavidus plantarum TaxID=942865 RepID=A0A316F4B3_9BURK|nr:hypothetical protein C7419_1012817 [Cupriavidus plantarum]
MAVHRRDIKLLSQLMHGEIIRNDRSFFEQSKSQHSAIDEDREPIALLPKCDIE